MGFSVERGQRDEEIIGEVGWIEEEKGHLGRECGNLEKEEISNVMVEN